MQYYQHPKNKEKIVHLIECRIMLTWLDRCLLHLHIHFQKFLLL